MTIHTASAPARPPIRTGRRVVVVIGGVGVLAALAVASLFIGSGDISPADVISALTGTSGNPDDLIVRDYRVPRTLLAIVVGAALGLAGTVIQAITRNPLADPGILGVNFGAYAAVVFAAAFLGSSLGFGHVWIALGGALAATLLVYAIGTTGPGSDNPSKLILTGVALGAVLSGVGFGVSLLVPEVFDRVRFWSAGSLQGRSWPDLAAVLPFIVVGIAVALLLPRALNALSLGDDVAVAIGARPAVTRSVGVASVTLLCGAATAAAGPIAFVGLIVPHALRPLVGPDHRWLVPLSVLAAPILMLSADILGRVVVSSELPAGVVTALIGAPVLIALVRRSTVRSL